MRASKNDAIRRTFAKTIVGRARQLEWVMSPNPIRLRRTRLARARPRCRGKAARAAVWRVAADDMFEFASGAGRVGLRLACARYARGWLINRLRDAAIRCRAPCPTLSPAQ